MSVTTSACQQVQFVSAFLFVVLFRVDLITEALNVCVAVRKSRESVQVSAFAVSINFSNVLYCIFMYAM